MTAINIIRHRDSVSIMTDTAGYDADGVVRSFVTKCITIPQMRAAVATRGSGFATALFATNYAAKFQTFDALVAGAGAFSDHLHAYFIHSLAESGETEVEIFLAGWSEGRNRPESYTMFSDFTNGMEPWKLHAAPSVLAGPVPDEEYMEAAGIDTRREKHLFDPTTDGLRLMQAQRAMRFPCGPTQAPRHVVGGSVVLTMIRSDLIGQKVIHRWSDAIDELINPDPLAAPSPLSRQQRRAAARQAARV